MGGGGGGAKGMLALRSQIIGGGAKGMLALRSQIIGGPGPHLPTPMYLILH